MTITTEQQAGGGPGLWQRLELHEEPPAAGAAGSLWPALQQRLAAARPCPRLRRDLVVKPAPADGGGGAILADPAGGRYFRLGEREAFLLTLFDGQRDLSQVAQAAAERLGPLPDQALDQFVWDLGQAGLLDQAVSLWQRLAAPRRSGPAVVWSLAGAEEKLEALYGRLRGLFHPVTGAAALFLLVQAVVLVIRRASLVRADVATLGDMVQGGLGGMGGHWGPPLLMAACCYLIMAPVVLTHELAHALTCIHHGGRVARLGLMVRHFLPAAFADISDLYFLPRTARIAVYLAGPASTLAWAGLAATVWAFWPAGSYVHLIAGAVGLLAALNALVSLNPVGGYDGSEALGEWLGRPDLHRQALTYWRDRLRRRVQAPERQRVQAPEGQRVLTWYGLGFLAYNVAVLAAIAAVIYGLVR